MSQHILKEVIELLDEKIDCIDKMIAITEKQKEAIVSEDTDILDLYINQKQNIIDEVDSLDAILKEQIKQIDSEDLLKSRLDKLNLCLKDLAKLDSENKRLLEEKMNDMKSKLQEVKQGQKMAKGYGIDSHKDMGSFFIDQKN